jgi:uncharacterized protein YxjI
MKTMALLLLLCLLLPCVVVGWIPSWQVVTKCHSSCLQMNIFSDIGDLMTGGKLVPQTSLPYGAPLCPSISISPETRIFAIQERPFSFTGEDFDVYNVQANTRVGQVSGAMLHLPGKDKMRIRTNGDVVAVLDRKLIALTPTYDIYRQDGKKLGWIEKVGIALTDTFDVFLEGQGGFAPFKPPPAYRIQGDFIDRNFVVKNSKNEVVAKVAKDGLIQFDAFNHYQVQCAPGMDAVLVIACACAVDEEFDEEHKEQKRKTEQGGGWFN